MCSEGDLGSPGTMAMEPGRAGSSASEPAELATSYSSESEAERHRRRRSAADAATRPGLPVRKDSTRVNPRGGSGPSESARPKREQPVEGARNPEDGRCRVRQTRVNRISSAHVARGAQNPRRGDPTGHGRRRHQGPNPEGAVKPVEVAVRSSDRADGRIAEDLAVVKTTRRERRTDDAATRSGALREARETPRGSSPGRRRPGGTALVRSETPEGASTD
jgi:hypothetical protein